MEQIIHKAIEGGYGGLRKRDDITHQWTIYHRHGAFAANLFEAQHYAILDPLFWQALIPKENQYAMTWHDVALQFYSINLRDGWNVAISYLLQVINSK